MSSRDFPPSLEQPPLSKPQTPPFSIIKARKLLAEYLGLQEKTAGIVSILTQQSRLASQNTIDEQEAGSIAWLALWHLELDWAWGNRFFRALGIDLNSSKGTPDRRRLQWYLEQSRIRHQSPLPSHIGILLDNLCGIPVSVTRPAPYFEINRLYSKDNNMHMELCGLTDTNIAFYVKNERLGTVWHAIGGRLTGDCRSYMVIYDITSGSTWYSIDACCHQESYGTHVRCFTTNVKPYGYAHLEIEEPHHNFVRRISLT